MLRWANSLVLDKSTVNNSIGVSDFRQQLDEENRDSTHGKRPKLYETRISKESSEASQRFRIKQRKLMNKGCVCDNETGHAFL